MPEHSLSLNRNRSWDRYALETQYLTEFDQAVDQFAALPALRDAEQGFSFRQVGNLADQIAALIQNDHRLHQHPIGLLIGHRISMIPAMLGVLKSVNHFYVMDPSLPEHSLEFMLAETGSGLILADKNSRDLAGKLSRKHQIPWVCIEDLDPDHAAPRISPPIKADHISQINFTSGSTGQPKGVLYTNRVMTRSLATKLNRETLDSGKRHSFLTLFSFGSPITTILASIFTGGEIILYDFRKQGLNDLKGWINREQITNFKITGTVFRQFLGTLTPDDRFPSLQFMRIGGEKLYPTDLAAIKKHVNPDCLFNIGLSTTETITIASANYRFDQLPDWEIVPVGFPAKDVNVFIWDENNQPRQAGEVGEIVVEGDALAAGYLNQPELTQQKFLPGISSPDHRIYKTGDLGRFNPDGSLVHLGRIDQMLKIRGVRIEPAGIENHLLSFPGVKNAAVTAWAPPGGEKKLVAYVQTSEHERGFENRLREYVSSKVAGTMLPTYYVVLDEFPLTPTGKLDRNKLPAPDLTRPSLPNDYVGPADPIEEKLLRVWERALGIQGVGVEDRFFELGGDSLTAAVLFVEIEAEFNQKFPLSLLMKAETIRSQARILRDHEYLVNWSPVVPIQTSGARAPIFCFAGKGGNPLGFRALAELIGPDHPIYFMQSRGLDGSRPLSKIPDIASDFIAEIRKQHPVGPYHFIGASFGGLVAYEIASHLPPEEAGLVVLLDTYAPKTLPKKLDQVSRFRKILIMLRKHFRLFFLSGVKSRKEYLRYYQDFLPMVVRNRIRNAGLLIGRMFSTSDLQPALRKVEEANLRAARSYTPPPYDGAVLLIKAKRQDWFNQRGPTLGWDSNIIRNLLISEVDGHHGGILFYPAVEEVYEILKAHLDLGHQN
jgi:amino acid adenylation domain-containing protein